MIFTIFLKYFYNNFIYVYNSLQGALLVRSRTDDQILRDSLRRWTTPRAYTRHLSYSSLSLPPFARGRLLSARMREAAAAFERRARNIRKYFFLFSRCAIISTLPSHARSPTALAPGSLSLRAFSHPFYSRITRGRSRGSAVIKRRL